ncbi:hypothetical protein PENPOL_c005G10436 [Penicillium polonicum]|uniref:Uncharacterized protein n=1 Tax=Penicillium polonicum TaxID=60169 RepID=A0A1V6NLQ5_PENPO|nr:hypothetical protein PENPOL_c005G10436 [Penicillium polonicum]
MIMVFSWTLMIILHIYNTQVLFWGSHHPSSLFSLPFVFQLATNIQTPQLLRKVSSFTLGLCITVYGGYTFLSRVFDFEAADARAFQDLQQATLQQQRMINELIQRNTELSNQLFRRGSLEEEVEADAGGCCWSDFTPFAKGLHWENDSQGNANRVSPNSKRQLAGKMVTIKDQEGKDRVVKAEPYYTGGPSRFVTDRTEAISSHEIAVKLAAMIPRIFFVVDE